MIDEAQISKRAAEALSSPEQLQLMRITSPKGWIALAALAGVLLTALLWSVFGRVPAAVHGQGLLIRGGSVYDVISVGAGVVTQIEARVSQVVSQQQIVARISQPELEMKMRHSELELRDLIENDQKTTQSETEALRLDLFSLALERTNLLTTIGDYEQQISLLERKLGKQKEALQAGLIVESATLETQLAIFSAQHSRAQARLRLNQILAAEVERPLQVRQQQNARRQHIEDASRALQLMQKQIDLTSIIRSPYSGRVLELSVEAGNMISAGGRLLSLESVDGDLEALVFVLAEEGKGVRQGMSVRVSPSTAKKEEDGFILGSVSTVLPFPATAEGMMRVLRNSELVRYLSQHGPPIQVHVSLQKDERGYKWSTGSRAPPEIPSGALCSAAIIVQSQRPISLLFPKLNRVLRTEQRDRPIIP